MSKIPRSYDNPDGIGPIMSMPGRTLDLSINPIGPGFVPPEALEKKAPQFCRRAAELMEERAAGRDKPSGERSMSRAIATFNAMTGHKLSVEDGWLFMVYLKHARMRQGKFVIDDYEDAVAYEALMAEEAADVHP